MIRPPKGRAPYAYSTVPIDRTKTAITKLLRDYGAEGVVWADNLETGSVSLQFAITREDGLATGFRISPAAFKERHSTYDPMRGRNVVTELPNWPRAMRLLYAWLKTKLESIAFGLTEVEEEFMAQMLVRDATGQEDTVGHLVLPVIEAGGGRLALEAPKVRDNVIDAESVTVP